MQIQITDITIHLIEGAGIVALAFVGLKIQNAVKDVLLKQAGVKEDLQKQQGEIKSDLSNKHYELIHNQQKLQMDFNTKHAENKQVLAVHIAQDEEKFDAIEQSLSKID